MGPHDPACYFGKREQCEGFVNSFLLPTLATPVGQCLIKYVTGPAWRACDELTCKGYKSPTRESAAGAAKGVVVLTVRPVAKEMYTKEFDRWAKQVQSSTAGVRAMFSFMDKHPGREGFALQIAWYDSPEVLASVALDPKVEACYAATETAFGAVFGDRSSVTKQALAATGVTYEYGTLPRGFMKSAPHPSRSFSSDLMRPRPHASASSSHLWQVRRTQASRPTSTRALR